MNASFRMSSAPTRARNPGCKRRRIHARSRVPCVSNMGAMGHASTSKAESPLVDATFLPLDGFGRPSSLHCLSIVSCNLHLARCCDPRRSKWLQNHPFHRVQKPYKDSGDFSTEPDQDGLRNDAARHRHMVMGRFVAAHGLSWRSLWNLHVRQAGRLIAASDRLRSQAVGDVGRVIAHVRPFIESSIASNALPHAAYAG